MSIELLNKTVSVFGKLADFVNRLSISIFLFGASVGTVYGFSYFVVYPALERLRGLDPPKGPPYAISDILEEIPKGPALYVFLAALIGVYVVWRWWMFVNLRKSFRGKVSRSNGEGLTTRDWNVAQGLRERALALRTRADLILGAGVVLLFAGVYFVLFIIPMIVEDDTRRIEQALFNQEFGRRLEWV